MRAWACVRAHAAGVSLSWANQASEEGLQELPATRWLQEDPATSQLPIVIM